MGLILAQIDFYLHARYAASRYVLAASVCLSTQNLENYWSEIDVTR